VHNSVQAVDDELVQSAYTTLPELTRLVTERLRGLALGFAPHLVFSSFSLFIHN